MRTGYGRAILAVGSVLILPASVSGAGPGQSSVAPPPAGAAILTEQSVWRTHVTWGKILTQGGAGLKEWGAWWAQLKAAQSSLPPEDWRQPDFDDSSWGLWRETHVPNTLKTKDGTDTGVRVYDEWQYGIQLSTFMALRCLRGKFRVDDPGQVKSLTLSAAYRGGVVAYLNGQEVGRGHVPKPAAPDPACPAEAYPDDTYYGPDGKLWRLVNTGRPIPSDAAALEKFNQRIRNLTVSIPVSTLRKGTNVLAVEIHRAPYSEKAGGDGMGWSTCGAATIELRADGAVTPATGRPKGLQVWNASILTKASPFGSITAGRIGQGAGVRIHNFPLSWVSPEDRLGPIRIVGTRNGVFSGQVIVSADSPIRNVRAEIGDLTPVRGGAKMAASACRVLYSLSPKEPPAELSDPPVSLLDALWEQAPAEVPALAGKAQAAPAGLNEFRGLSWCDSAALMPVWLRVRIPASAAPGEYEGKLVIHAEGAAPATVPVRLAVHGYVLPDPKDFITHVGMVHSPDTLALKYRVPMWSDAHFGLMEKSLQYMNEVGGKVAWVNLICNAWLGNRETTVYWVKKPEGGYAYDFRVFDRYMDLVQKHLKLEAACVYVFHPPYPPTPTPKGRVSVLDAATGKVDTMETPVYAPTPEAVDFWKPVLAEVSARLKKRGLPEALNLAMVVEGGGNNMSNVVAVFKGACPDAKWVNLAHYGGQKGNIHGTPYGYVMSVWGNYTPYKSKEWAAADLPLIILQHFRADPVIDLRPISSRGSQFWATERAIGGMRGIGPLGADFWNLTAEEGGWKGGARALENYVTNLNMNHFTTAAYLAPGPDGPISTARFEIFRHGVQMAEVRTFLQKALGKPETRQRLGDALAKRCEEVIRDRSDRAMQYVGAGERFAQGEGWKWFETSDWQELDGKLFDCAEEAAKALAAK